MKRMTNGSRWMSGIGVVGVGVTVAALSTGGLSPALASDAKVSAPKVAAVADHSVKTVALKDVSRPVAAKKSTVQISSFEVEQMVAMVRQVADPSGGRLTQVRRDDVERSASLLAVSILGDFQMSAWLTDDPDGLQTGHQNCRADQQHPEDGRICKTLRSAPSMGIWSRDYASQPGRQTVQLAAKARDGGTLWMEFNNYTETADGSKQVGPRWKDVGITVRLLKSAAEYSSLIEAD